MDSQMFIVDGRMYGVVRPLENADTGEIDLWLCQSTVPMPPELFEAMTPEDQFAMIDPLVAVFRTADNAMSFMQWMFDITKSPVPEKLIPMLMEGALDHYDGTIIEREKLSLPS